MEFTINNLKYIVEEFAPGRWFWAASNESIDYFPSALEALQDALNYVQAAIDEGKEDLARRLDHEIYGTYDKQVDDYYKSTRL